MLSITCWLSGERWRRDHKISSFFFVDEGKDPIHDIQGKCLFWG